MLGDDESGDASAAAIVDALLGIGKLKTTRRTGWHLRGISPAESVADHSWRMATMCLLLADLPSMPPLDRARCVQMALVHDLAEAEVGDITPHDGVPKEQKHRLEAEGMAKLLRPLAGTTGAVETSSLWQEYEGAASAEAQFVKDVDKLDMVLQAWQYELDDTSRDLSEFFSGVDGKIRTPALKQVYDHLVGARQQHRDSRAS